MNINAMSNDQAMDAMVRISSVLSFILEDKEIRDLMNDLGGDKGKDMTLLDGVTKYLPRITMIAAKKHRESLYEIVGALEQKDAKTVGKMNFMKTLTVIQENWSELKSFFQSFVSSGEMTGT